MKIIFPVIFTFLGVSLLFANSGLDYLGFTGFLFLALLWFFFYPKWESRHYLRQYKAFVKGHYPEGKEESLMLEIGNDHIKANDNVDEGSVATSEIESIDEIPSMFFILLKGGEGFIIPKNQVDFSHVKTKLIEISKYLNVPYILNENWKWA
ncbi:MAG: YcxB family protein [Bacteroidales bacterium]|nr:YcxB family protein [Bacteroidales bacterium]